MNRFISLTKYNLKLLFRDINSILFAFLMPIGFYILFSNMLKGMSTGENSIQELLIPMYTIIIIGNAVIVVFGGFFSQAKESGNLTKYKFLGVNELAFSSSLYTATIIFQILVVVSFIIFTQVYAGIVFPITNLLSIIIVLIIINIFQFAVSYFLNAIISKSSLYNSIALAFYMYQMFLGGLTFPLEMFPEFLRKAVYFINPIIYGRNALIDVWVKQTGIIKTLPNLLILLAFSFTLIFIGVLINKSIQNNKTQTPVDQI